MTGEAQPLTAQRLDAISVLSASPRRLEARQTTTHFSKGASNRDKEDW